MTESLSRRYCVLTEGQSEGIKGHLVLPGAVRMPCDQDILPVTLDYKHDRIIGAAGGFARGGVIDGISKITFDIRFNSTSGVDHDFVRPLVPGVYISSVFAFQEPGEHLKWITDGIIREISFYDPRPPAIKVSDGGWD